MSYMTIDAVDERGEPCEALVLRRTCPPCGEWFDDEGRRLQRVPSRARVHVERTEDVIGWSLPRLKAVKKAGFTRAKHYDEKGRARFGSKAEINEYMARANDNPKEGVQRTWNPDGNE